MSVREAPSWLQHGSHSAEDDRLLLEALLGGGFNRALTSGIVSAPDLLVAQTTTPSMNLEVAAGGAFIVGTEAAAQGVYHLVNDAPFAVTISTSDATNDRIDLVIAQILDDMYTGDDNLGQIIVVKGTAAGSPTPPAVPKNSIVLAQVTVGHGVTSITTSHIADVRVQVATSTAITGELRMFGAGTPGAGWAPCDGSALSRTVYSALFAYLGTTWGPGDGVTTFNVPDLRGRGPIGAGTGAGLTARAVGTGNIGEEAHVLSTGEIPGHNHGVTDAGHAHGIKDNNGRDATGNIMGTSASTGEGYQSAPTGDHASFTGLDVQGATTGITTQSAGGGGGHNNMQPSAVVSFYIKT